MLLCLEMIYHITCQFEKVCFFIFLIIYSMTYFSKTK